MPLSYEDQLIADVEQAKANKKIIKRAVTWVDAKKLKARRGIEMHQEQKRLMEPFEL